MEKPSPIHPAVRAWFALTEGERWLLAAIVGLALLGLTARYVHQRTQRPDPAPAALLQETES